MSNDTFLIALFYLKNTHPRFFTTFSSTSVPKCGFVNALPFPRKKKREFDRFLTNIIATFGLN